MTADVVTQFLDKRPALREYLDANPNAEVRYHGLAFGITSCSITANRGTRTERAGVVAMDAYQWDPLLKLALEEPGVWVNQRGKRKRTLESWTHGCKPTHGSRGR